MEGIGFIVILSIGMIILAFWLQGFQSKIKKDFERLYPNYKYTESTLFYIVEDSGIVLVPKVGISDKSKHVKIRNINEIKLFEDGKENSSTGKAIAGAVAFGTTGAVIGANMKGKSRINNMGIRIYTDDRFYELNFVGNGCERESLKYKQAVARVQKTYNLLLKYSKAKEENEILDNEDIPNKIEKLAVLLEKNIISKEDFEAKKKELLARM